MRICIFVAFGNYKWTRFSTVMWPICAGAPISFRHYGEASFLLGKPHERKGGLTD